MGNGSVVPKDTIQLLEDIKNDPNFNQIVVPDKVTDPDEFFRNQLQQILKKDIKTVNMRFGRGTFTAKTQVTAAQILTVQKLLGCNVCVSFQKSEVSIAVDQAISNMKDLNTLNW